MHPVSSNYDAILYVSFGGPEGMDDVMPFLENVLRGKNVPRQRMLEVAAHYEHFHGVSPINEQNRSVIAALQPELARRGIDLPVFWGNRNWHPMLDDTLREMSQRGVRRALAYVTSAYSSYSGCRQYRENIAAAIAKLSGSEIVPEVDKIRAFFNHPRFIRANVERVRSALESIDPSVRSSVHIAFTAHSIPSSMARGCAYESQLTETSRLIAEQVGVPKDRWNLVYQSRSGRPTDPWLEPDILDHIRFAHAAGTRNLLIHPVGFLTDHVEVLYDLDTEARTLAEQLGMQLTRAATVGHHPEMIGTIADLIEERLSGTAPIGCDSLIACAPHICPVDCCPAPVMPPAGIPRAGTPPTGMPPTGMPRA